MQARLKERRKYVFNESNPTALLGRPIQWGKADVSVGFNAGKK